MFFNKDIKKNSSLENSSLGNMLHRLAMRYLEALLGFYITKKDDENIFKIRKIIAELRGIQHTTIGKE